MVYSIFLSFFLFPCSFLLPHIFSPRLTWFADAAQNCINIIEFSTSKFEISSRQFRINTKTIHQVSFSIRVCDFRLKRGIKTPSGILEHKYQAKTYMTRHLTTQYYHSAHQFFQFHHTTFQMNTSASVKTYRKQVFTPPLEPITKKERQSVEIKRLE